MKFTVRLRSPALANPAGVRVPLLDLARLLAALAVLAYHYGFHGGVTGKYLDVHVPALGNATRYGYLGVNVFFVISGFVIAWSASGTGAARFAWRRWLRVYPTFVFCVLLTSGVVALAGDRRFDVSATQVLAHAVVDARRLGHDFVDGVYWTIVCELQFYAMVALGLAVPWLRRRATACMAAWLAMAALNEAVFGSTRLAALALTPFAGLFVLGMLMYRWHRGERSLVLGALTMAALALSVASELQQAAHRFELAGTDWSAAAVIALLLGSIAALAMALHVRPGVATERWLRRLGALTYPLYLLHATIGFIVINRLAPLLGPLPAIGLATAGTLGLAGVVATSIEPRLKAACVALAARCRGLRARALQGARAGARGAEGRPMGWPEQTARGGTAESRGGQA